MSLKTVCHCGHDMDTHFEKRHSCLASQCDCRWYRDEAKPDPLKPCHSHARPICWECVPDTQRAMGPHPSWCVCGVCLQTFEVRW